MLRGFFLRDFFKELSNKFSNEKFLVYFYSSKQLLLTLSAQWKAQCYSVMKRGLCQATVCTLFFCCPNCHKGCTLHQVKERGTGGPDGGQNHVDQVCFGCPIVTNSWLRWNGNSDGDVTVRDVMRVMALWNEVGNQFIRPRFISIVMRCFHRLVPSVLLKPWKNEYFP